MDYTNYIATQKANVELYKAAMRKVDDKYVNIKNNFFAFQLTHLSERKMVMEKEKEKEELLIALKKLYKMIDTANARIKEVLDFTELAKKIEMLCKIPKEDLYRTLDEPIKEEISSIKESLIYNINDELRDIVEGNIDSINTKLQTNFHKIISNMFNEKIGDCQKKINGELDKKQKLLSIIDKDIQEDIDLFNDNLNQSLQVNNIKITLPKLELAFTRKNFDFSKVDAKAITEIYEIQKKSHYQKYGVMGRLMKLAPLNHVDKRFGKYELDHESIDEILSSLLPDIKNEVVSAIEENNNKILEDVTTYLLEELQRKIKSETEAMIYNYKELILEIKESIQASESDLENDINFIQEKIDFLEVAKNSLHMFFDLWEKVRHQADASTKYTDNRVAI